MEISAKTVVFKIIYLNFESNNLMGCFRTAVKIRPLSYFLSKENVMKPAMSLCDCDISNYKTVSHIMLFDVALRRR